METRVNWGSDPALWPWLFEDYKELKVERWTWQTESWWCTIIPSLVACEVYFSGSEAIFWTEMWHTDTQTDKRTDGQPDSSIPPTKVNMTNWVMMMHHHTKFGCMWSILQWFRSYLLDRDVTHGHTDRQTDRWTTDSSIPPTNYITLRGGTIKNTIHTWKVVVVVSNIAL